MRSLLFIMVIVAVFSSCKVEDKAKRPSFIAYNLNGGPCSGAFRIDEDGDENTLEFVASLFPAFEDNPAVIIITFSDPMTGQNVYFQLPAEETGSNPVLITRDNEYYGMSIQHNADECVLTHGAPDTNLGVSVDVKKVRKGNGALGAFLIDELEVYFVGKMTQPTQSGELVEYTVEGDFYYGGIL